MLKHARFCVSVHINCGGDGYRGLECLEDDAEDGDGDDDGDHYHGDCGCDD